MYYSLLFFLFLYYFLLLHHFIKNIWISGTANNQGSGRCHGYGISHELMAAKASDADIT